MIMTVQWPYVIEGTLFSCKQIQFHYSPFKFFNNRFLILSVNIKHSLSNAEYRNPDDLFHMKIFDSFSTSATTTQEEIYEKASENIEKA